ncbi:hypothetical protein PIROE2DRAFT_57543 [Piromyces sp. E2]|nr:hypothetical protein PIROE2DRAFT_57543 [Piromyces sp. E2]|eukprot:OUM69165.1 hypothetical protein PIROE2DRAFT_57543 [Piromyces sp. E2]
MAPKITILKERSPINYNSREVINAKTYLEQHKIPEIITQLTTMLFYLQPDNPKKFLIEKLVHIKAKKLDAYTYFTEENLKALFKIFDVTEKGYISTAQYLSAMKNIGVKNINDTPEGSKYDAISLETFVKEGQKKNKKLHDTGNYTLKRINIKAKEKSIIDNFISQVNGGSSGSGLSNDKNVHIEPLNIKEKSITIEKENIRDDNKERGCNFEIDDSSETIRLKEKDNMSSNKSISTSKISKDEYFSSDKFTMDSYNVLNPIQYYKKLNGIINKVNIV